MGDIVGIDAVDDEADDSGFATRVGAQSAQTRDLFKQLVCKRSKAAFVLMNRRQIPGLQIRYCLMKRNRCGDRYCALLILRVSLL